MDIFDLFATIKLDSSEYEQGLAAAEGRANGFGSMISGGFSTAMKVGAAAVGAASAAVTAFTKSSVDTGTAFDATMSKVAAISGATGEDFDKLREKAIEMGGSTKFSATEAGEAMSYMAMAGWKTEDMMNGLSGIMNLAAASGEDLATTSDIVTDALTAFGLQASDSARFADVLAAAASNSNTNVGMMGETFKYFAPLAGTFKFSMEDTAVAVGLMANSGIKASQAGTALRAAFSRMAKPTKQAHEALARLGLEVDGVNLLLTDEEGQVRSLGNIMDILRGSLGGLTDAEKARVATQLFGQEAMSGMLAIVNASEADYEKLRNAIDGASEASNGFNGAAEEMAATMETNLQGAITSFNSAMETMKIRINDVIKPIATDFVNLGTEAVRGFSAAFQEGGLDAAMDSLQEPISKFIGLISKYLPTIIKAGASIINSLIQGITDNMDTIVDGSVTVLMAFVNGLITALPQLLEGGVQIIAGLAQAIMDNSSSILETAGQIVQFLWQGMVEGLPMAADAAVGFMAGLAEYLTTALPELIPVALNAVMEFSGSLRENAGKMIDGALGLIMALADGLIDSLPAMIETIPTIVTNIAGIINDNAPKLIVTGVVLIGKLVVGIVKAIPTLIAEFPKIIKAIVDVITAFNWVKIGAGIIKFIGDGIKSLATSLPQALKDIGTKAVEWLKLIQWKTLGRDIIDLIVIGIKALVNAIPNALKAIGTNAIKVFKSINWKDLGMQIIRGIISGLTGGIGSVVDGIKKVGSSIVSGAKKVFKISSPSRLFRDEIGANIAKGLALGITDSIPMVENAMDGMNEALVSNVDISGGGVLQGLPALIPATDNKNITVVLELDGYQFGRAVYRYNQSEMQRVGVNLAGGFA